MQIKYGPNLPGEPPSPFRKVAALVVTAVLVVLALMFSAVVLAVIFVLGAIASGYLWWKTREVRKQMRAYSSQAAEVERQPGDDAVFEGEVIRVVEPDEVR
ncbi:MAG: hypothetical protein KJ795_07350 [Gammaproteobacteria bacterium]|nr:hypothetical protein [Gammaproteobacteria bacterium]MBU1777562.1 hypothetical protein [Gammaproteobacteria bacterium]MBU1969801.1 hypothetical protein [Gammaproteobacteria bacterium]